MRLLDVIGCVAGVALLIAAANKAGNLANAEAHTSSGDENRADRVAIPQLGDDSISALSEAVSRHNLFRAARRPSLVELLAGVEERPAVAAPSRPSLRLVGIVGGPPWSALLEGVPGRETTVMAISGDTLSGITLVRVEASRVLITGFDTTWTLILLRPPS